MKVEPASALRGHIAVPGDKSISHRAVLLGAIGDGETAVRGFGRSGDTEATIAAVRALGVTVHEDDVDALRVEGVGLRGLREPDAPIDCGNSGTTLRLLAGILAGQEGRFELTGDESLRRRPVDRIAGPLGRDGRAGRERRRQAAARDRGRRAARDPLRAAGRQRAGEVVHPARGPVRGRPHDRRRAAADARPHRADARGRRRAGDAQAAARLGRPGRAVCASARSTFPATSPRPRPSSSRPRCCPGRS